MPVGNNVSQEQMNAVKLLVSQVEPQLQADQATQANYQQQLNNIPDQIKQQNQYATTMAGYQAQNLGISEQQLGLQGAGQGISNQLAKQQQGYEQQQFGVGQQQQALNFAGQQQNLIGSLASSGALNTEGSKRQQYSLDVGNQLQTEQANLGQASELAGYAAQQGGTAGGVNYGGGQAGLAQQNLQLMAQANGLSGQQLQDQLNYGIAQNKQQGITSAGQLLGQMGSLAAGDISIAGQAIAPIGYSSGVNPFAPPKLGL